jgi:hypothetical protein
MEPMGPMPVDPEYPGIEFFPPEGTINPRDNEGEVLVKWKKIGDKFTLTELDGKPLAPYKIPMSKREIEDKKETMRAVSAFDEIDQIANLYPQ